MCMKIDVISNNFYSYRVSKKKLKNSNNITFCSKLNIMPGRSSLRKFVLGLASIASVIHPISANAQKFMAKNTEIVSKLLCGLDSNFKELKIIEDINFEGGKTFRFDEMSVEKLKKMIISPSQTISYMAPIENAPNVYLDSFGLFGAKRPKGRPHMGLDIFVSKFGRKPSTPVQIHAPIDGIVIAIKKANDNNNKISNAVTILGIDGRKYAFDHMARKKDYPNHPEIIMPKVGTRIKKGDVLGYVGHTGETSLWHLHLIVMTEESLKQQLADPKWIELSQKSNYTVLRGQVDPLSKADAGDIADELNQYNKVIRNNAKNSDKTVVKSAKKKHHRK